MGNDGRHLIGVRNRGKKLIEQGKEQAKKAREVVESQVDRSPALQKTMDRLGVAGKWTWEKFGEAQRAVKNKMKLYMRGGNGINSDES